MSIAKVENGEIVEVMPINDPIDSSWRYVYDPSPDMDSRYQVCTGYDYAYDANTNVVTATPQIEYLPVEVLIEKRLDDLAAYRWELQNSGTTVMGMFIPTDVDTQRNMLGARVAAMANSQYTVDWKTPAGFMTFDATAITFISDGIRAHIQDCFNAEKYHLQNINSLNTAEDVIAYDFTANTWPT